jgi:hypothetical protein
LSLPLVSRTGLFSSSWRKGRPVAGVICSALLAAGTAEARDADFGTHLGTIAGRVESPGGTPVGGAVISVFGNGRGSFTAVSDGEGRFSLDLPPGRYTLRTLAGGFVPAAARRILVAAERELLLDISLAANEAAASLASARPDPAAVRELRWLIRHKRRSVLEERGSQTLLADDGSAPAPLARVEGSCWILAAPPTNRPAPALEDDTTGASAVAVGGDLPRGHWSAGGVWPEGHSAAWRAAAELSMNPGPRTEWRAASGYAGREGIGTLLTEGRWRMSSRVAASAGVRYTYGPSEMSEHDLDPIAGLEISRLPGRGLLTLRTQGSTRVAGGDPVLNPAGPVGAVTVSGSTWPMRRQRRHDASLDWPTRTGSIGVLAFSESSEPRPRSSIEPSRLGSQGAGFRVTRCFGSTVRGAMTYACGRRLPSIDGSRAMDPVFHELIAEVEARLERSGTRFSAYSRVHRAADAELVSRFDLQVRQGLPFMDGISQSRWEVLVAVRNLVYESTEPGSLDELLTAKVPARVVGGISVKF